MEYKNMTDKEIDDLLLKLGKQNWHTNEKLLKEGLLRWLKLSRQKDIEVKE